MEESMFRSLFFGAPPFFMIVFIVVFGIIAVVFISLIVNAVLNASASPETIIVTLIGKDTSLWGQHNNNTSYTFIFEDETGNRLNFNVRKSNYHQYVVGDYGRLTYQRKLFKEFELMN